MVVPAWSARFLESTRGRIVSLLRRASRTVDELAASLDLTDNAVRLHLGALERDGIVRSAGVRRGGGVGKPATVYEIEPAAEPGFSSAYLPFLATLLDALGDRMEPHELETLMRDVGRRLAVPQRRPRDAADLAQRAALASRLLESLGGVTSVEREGDHVRIRGCACPLSVAVERRAEVCVAVQAMLAEVTGTSVRECCDRGGERASCSFELGARAG
jgi:predicted ArsR family transcriptional regulator